MMFKLINQQYTGHAHGQCKSAVMVSMSNQGDGPDFAAICDDIAKQLYGAKISTGEIPRDLYEATATRLMDAVFSGLGDRKTFAYEDPRNMLVAHLRQNVYAFSAAKSLTEMQVFNDLMIGEDGKIKPFVQYRNDCTKAGKVFNISHLKVDHSTALASAQIAQTFNQFGADDYIEVRTTGAENVCPICGSLNGFTRPKSATIWQSFCPPFHEQCNCNLIPGQQKNAKKHDDPKQMLKDAGVKPYFQSNPAISKVIYTDGYPYMQNILKKNSPLHWDKAYNMQTLDRIYKDKLPDALPVTTKGEAQNWWKDQAGTLKGSFLLKDKLGTVVKFDNEVRNHVFEQNNDQRFEFLSNIPDIIQDPDEVWSTKVKGKLITTYIKYYEDFPYSVQTNELRAFTMTKYNVSGTGKLNTISISNDRSGILIYRK